jgi:heme exporter protein CcmD
MDWSAPHAGFVAAAYILSFAILVGLVFFVMLRDRASRRRIDDLERSGAPRRRAEKAR